MFTELTVIPSPATSTASDFVIAKHAARQRGVAALAHGNRGKVPTNAVDEETRQAVVRLASTRYVGFNQVHLIDAVRCGRRRYRNSVHPSLPVRAQPLYQ